MFLHGEKMKEEEEQMQNGSPILGPHVVEGEEAISSSQTVFKFWGPQEKMEEAAWLHRKVPQTVKRYPKGSHSHWTLRSLIVLDVLRWCLFVLLVYLFRFFLFDMRI